MYVNDGSEKGKCFMIYEDSKDNSNVAEYDE